MTPIVLIVRSVVFGEEDCVLHPVPFEKMATEVWILEGFSTQCLGRWAWIRGQIKPVCGKHGGSPAINRASTGIMGKICGKATCTTTCKYLQACDLILRIFFYICVSSKINLWQNSWEISFIYIHVLNQIFDI